MNATVYSFNWAALLCVLAMLPAAFLTYRRSIHMYQLCSYQNPSYQKYLRENTGESFSVKRLLPVLLMLVGCVWKWPVALVGAALFVLVNPIKKGKKELVWTDRVKRLSLTALIVYLLGSFAIYKSKDIIDALPGLLDYFQSKLLAFETSLDRLLRDMLPMLKDMPFLSLEKMMTPENAASSIDFVGILSTAGSAFFSIPDLLFTTVFIFMGTYFFTVQWAEVKGFIAHAFSPVLLEAASGLRNFLFTSVWRWIKAQMILICVTCTELCIAFLLMKQSNPIIFGMSIAVIDALPILGVGTILIPWSLFSLLTGSFKKALMLILTYIFILCVRNTLEPRVVGEKIGLNPFVTLLSMFIGFRLGGFFGLAFIPIAVLSILELQKLGYISLWEDHAEDK